MACVSAELTFSRGGREVRGRSVHAGARALERRGVGVADTIHGADDIGSNKLSNDRNHTRKPAGAWLAPCAKMATGIVLMTIPAAGLQVPTANTTATAGRRAARSVGLPGPEREARPKCHRATTNRDVRRPAELSSETK